MNNKTEKTEVKTPEKNDIGVVVNPKTAAPVVKPPTKTLSEALNSVPTKPYVPNPDQGIPVYVEPVVNVTTTKNENKPTDFKGVAGSFSSITGTLQPTQQEVLAAHLRKQEEAKSSVVSVKTSSTSSVMNNPVNNPSTTKHLVATANNPTPPKKL